MIGGCPARVLYVVACGSPVARKVGVLVDLARADGWDVCVVTTPDGRKFVDVAALATQTGHPVRTTYKNPGDSDVLPPPDAIIVAPATVNTINKWAAGIADTLALGLLVEAYGKDLPIVAMPYTNAAMAAHPVFRENIERLRSWGVSVLFGDDVVELHPPGTGDRYVDRFPWALTLDVLRVRLPTDGSLA
ncbi:flavoprotein [Catenuloplanes nepalensis]|uniref:flavoprotein n=1 Tax=Catenuloplanes nepalensis TaxID=587533 RepID=UPI0027D8CC9C|nr:flavoprotein [Catenuloplanes nepalensis]